MKVTVGVATYLRPEDIDRCLTALLAEIGRTQAERPELEVDVLVVDNDAEASARSVVTSYPSHLVTYVVEPSPGISAARNRALVEATTSDILLFIDDDEEPVPGWLLRMVNTHDQWQAPVVAGRVVSNLDDVDDPWILESGFFNRRALPTGTPISVAATNNLLLELRVVKDLGLTFAERYGLTGGGDTHFTRSLARAGVPMVWCNEAVVVDHVPASRLTRSWILARARRMGNTEVVVDIDIAPPGRRLRRRLRGVARGSVRVAGGMARRAAGQVLGSTSLRSRGAVTMQRGRGMLNGAFGHRVAEYARGGAQPAVGLRS